jgi:hypothetical protein
MQKVIGRYNDATLKGSFIQRYRLWKFGKPKHNYYMRNRKSSVLTFDQYDKYIIENLKPGKTIIYDSAGYYLDEAVDDLVIIELNPTAKKIYPKVLLDTGPDSVKQHYYQADNFIVNNTIQLRWKTFEDYTRYWKFQTRFLKPGAQIFFSFRDIFIFHNRLKYHLSELVVEWLEQMTAHGFVLNNLDHKLIAIDDTLVDLSHLPEVADMINGNIKIHWTYTP